MIDIFEMVDDYSVDGAGWFLRGYGYAKIDGSTFVQFLYDMIMVLESDEICPCLVEEEL